jgi:ribosomal protein L11 methyltransferase
MDWIELRIISSQEAQELLSNFLIELGSQGIVLEDDSPLPEFSDSGIEVKDDAGDSVIKAYFPSEEKTGKVEESVRAYLTRLENSGIQVGSKDIQIRVLHEEDWATNWKKYFKPIQLGRRLVIKPAWESYEAELNQIIVEIDPGMAFGTGKHETTQLCLELLEENVSSGMRILDVGTGSGILAIAAAKLGATQVLGLDTDPMALQYAQENVVKNAMQDRVSFQEGSLNTVELIHQSFDLMVVNIRPRVILSLLDFLKKYKKPEGILILSGILQGERQEIAEVLKKESLKIREERFKGDWVALVCTIAFT